MEHDNPLPRFVQDKCCLEFKEVEPIYHCVNQLLQKSLVGKTLYKFAVSKLLFCGSLKEGSRIKDPSENPVTAEFDILAVANYTGGNHREQEAGPALRMFMEATKKELSPQYFEAVPGEGGYEYIRFKGHDTEFNVLIDIHPAVQIHPNVFEIPLDSFWRESHVIKEIDAIKGSGHKHILSFRISKFARLLMEPRVRYSKYALKTAVLQHINTCGGCDVKSCVLDVLDVLYKGYKKKELKNIYSGQNVIQRHDGNPTTVEKIKELRSLLDQYFHCVVCLFERTDPSFLELTKGHSLMQKLFPFW